MTLLTIVEDVCDRLSLVRPSSAIGSTDIVVRQIVGLAQQEGKELASRASWQILQSEATFTAVAIELQTGAIPSDFDWYIPDTMFNRTTRRWVEGPLSPMEWQETQASLVTRVNPAFRIRGDAIYINQVPTAGHTFAYEYVSKNWCESEAGAGQAKWLADTDVPRIAEELHILGIVWRWKKAKGTEYGEDFATYERQVAQAIQRDGAKPRIYSDGVGRARVPTAPQAPETIIL